MTEKLQNYPLTAVEGNEKETPTNFEEMAKQAKLEDEKLHIASVEDKTVSGEQYEKVLQETKEMNPEKDLENINNQIAGLRKEIAISKEDYKNLFVRYSYDSPANTGSYNAKADALVDKYSGLDNIVATINKAKEASKPTKTEEKADNIWGKLFGAKKMNPAEMTTGAAQRIDNALTSGSVGLNATPESYKTVVDFLAKNSPEMLKTQKYQNILKEIGAADAEYLEANRNLLVNENEIIDQPTCIREAIGIWQEERNVKISELENKKTALESKMQAVA